MGQRVPKGHYLSTSQKGVRYLIGEERRLTTVAPLGDVMMARRQNICGRGGAFGQSI
jgi:hypothetical protein